MGEALAVNADRDGSAAGAGAAWTLCSGVLLAVVLAPAPPAACGETRARASAPAETSDPAGLAVLQQFLARPDEPVQRSRARRRIRGEGLGRRASMETIVELDHGEGLSYEVVWEEGSGALRNRGFRGMLEKEKAVHDSGRADETAFTAANYRLRFEGRQEDGLVRLRATPRRADHRLLDGVFVVTPDTADLVRVEGRLAKGPSFWTPRVDVVRHYRRIQGRRVVVRVEWTAHVRLLGKVRTVVDYEYEMIDGEEIEPSTAGAAFASASSVDPGPPGPEP